MVVLGDEDKKSNNHVSFETKKQKGISGYLFFSLVWLSSDCIFIGFESIV